MAKWGIMVQLYQARSRTSWGMGDFADLQFIIRKIAAAGGDFILTNPLNKLYSHRGHIEPSPYLPDSRTLLNPLYINPKLTPEYLALPDESKIKFEQFTETFARDNQSNEPMDYDYLWRAKEPALKVLCPLQTDFNEWLQQKASEQLLQCQDLAQELGMKIGLICDLPVGVHPDSEETRQNKNMYIRKLNVGAPPDNFNQLGQNWGQHPIDHRILEVTDFKLYRELFKEIYSQYGAMRIDHILGFFRLWCIPTKNSADKGAYIKQNHKMLIDILKQEADGKLIIAEDLGVVPTYVRPILKANGILSTVLSLENIAKSGELLKPSKLKSNAFASLLSHDHPPALGYIKGVHLELKTKLGLLKDPQGDKSKHSKKIAALKRQFSVTTPEGLVLALYKHLSQTPCELKCINLYDLAKQTVPVNQPGTHREYPNWSLPLRNSEQEPVFIEDVLQSNFAKQILSFFIRKPRTFTLRK